MIRNCADSLFLNKSSQTPVFCCRQSRGCVKSFSKRGRRGEIVAADVKFLIRHRSYFVHSTLEKHLSPSPDFILTRGVNVAARFLKRMKTSIGEFIAVGLCVFLFASCTQATFRDDPTVLVTLLVRNKAHTLPYFLKLFEELDYPKNRLTLW